ncbi:MAG: O-antigen ligase family protein [Thermoanaerobaculales bacterium]
MGRNEPEAAASPGWTLYLVGAGFLLGQVAVLPGATSQFRLPKEVVILTALAIAAGFGGAWALRRGTLVLPTGRLVMVLAALPALQALSLLWSENPRRAVTSALVTLIWVGGILWLSTLSAHCRRRLVLATALGAAISAAVMILQASGMKVLELGPASAAGRRSLTGLAGNPADLAMASVLLLPLLLTWGEESRRRWLYRALAALLALATLLSQTLTGLVALAAVLVVWLIRQRSRALWLVTVAFAVVLLAIALAAGLGARVERAAEQVRAGEWYILLSARGDGWTAGAEMVRNRPMLGVGAANYTQAYYPSRLNWLSRRGGTGLRGELASHFEWAHCDPLQQVAELGIPGALWILALVVAIAGARARAGPVLPLMAAASAPFLLLHYPTHVAVGLIPMALVLAQILAEGGDGARLVALKRGRLPIAAALVALALAGSAWQLRRAALSLWMGGLEQRLLLIQANDPDRRSRGAAAVEAQVLPRIGRYPGQAPTLWRTVGRARLLRGDARGAETAFRAAFAGWPHEDAEFYLGLSLAAQGRRSEALQHLGRVCRTNPALAALIPDPSLRQSVKDMVAVYRRTKPSGAAG